RIRSPSPRGEATEVARASRSERTASGVQSLGRRPRDRAGWSSDCRYDGLDGIRSVIVHVLAVDYDGTIAAHGRLDPVTARALAMVRESGRRLFLVTGRLSPDLRGVSPDVDVIFDAIVAENGAVVRFPRRRDARTLG